MWIAQVNAWHKSHTDLSKYFIERIKQRVDHEEIISNKHRTTNGYTLICEIIEVSTLALKRIKSVNRLISLINEAQSKLLPSSICNDFVLQNHHADIIDYYMSIKTQKLKDNSKDISEVLNRSKINFIRLQKQYYLDIKCEIEKIDFESSKFNRYSSLIDKLIDCFIPYLLHQGYSNTSISDIAYRTMKKADGAKSPLRLISNFDGTKRHYKFLIKMIVPNDGFKEITCYLEEKKVEYSQVSLDDIKPKLIEPIILSTGEELYTIKHATIDPHNYLRNLYDVALKNCVAKRNRLSLHYFTDFFECVYWRFEGTSKFQKSNMHIDPVNVPKRKSTLTETLLSFSHSLAFKESDPIPFIKEIRDSVYYYNLALGSKSIENSLSLLWTSLETLLPYRLKDNDIENVQYFVSKSLSLGAIGREVTSFASRFAAVNRLNGKVFEKLSVPSFSENKSTEMIKKWIHWIATDFSTSGSDPYDVIKPVSNLLCSQFVTLNDIYTGKDGTFTVEYWLNKIKASEASIAFQLDRIYLHRNQIVHSGKFINEYSNLWNHLEWYVGKLLSYCVIEYIRGEDNTRFNKEELFMKLEADSNFVTNLLEKNKERCIKDIPFTYELITKHSWQFF